MDDRRAGVLGGTAGVAIPFTGLPSGTSGTYDRTFDTSLASTYTPAFLAEHGGTAGAEEALASCLATGQAYTNVHNSIYPGGEIRGYLHPLAKDARASRAATARSSTRAPARPSATRASV